MSEIMRVQDLVVHFKNAVPGKNAVNGVSFSIEQGEILGLVGESGSGKTVTALSMSGLLDRSACERGGSITFCGRELLNCPENDLLDLQGDELSVVFQEPMSAMNPTMKIGRQIEESLRVHTKLTAGERKLRALQAMEAAELPNPEELYNKYPHELSGGMLQRAMIAGAIINKPQLLFADEPTTALDVTIQAEILQLLTKLSRENGMAVLFISHNLSVVRKLCSRVIVMQKGKIVEENTVEGIFENPVHEYTRQLIAAIPRRDRRLTGKGATDHE